jgi:hypothetical protein
VTDRLRGREIDDDERQRLVRIVRRGMIRRYISWRNNHAYDERLRRIIAKANVA